MRTPIAAALFATLAACGSDGGLSLTEPGEIERCSADTDGFSYPGSWDIDEWGCRIGAGDGVDCVPSRLPWNSDDEVSITANGDAFTVTIGGDSMTNAIGFFVIEGTMTNGVFVSVTGCTDGTLWIQALTEPGDIFGAFAHRR